jgi:small subunit ribosomal protein S7e
MAAAAPLPQPASIDETLASFDSVPLFMKSLPQDDTDNDAIVALQSLAFDGTPDGG